MYYDDRFPMYYDGRFQMVSFNKILAPEFFELDFANTCVS